MRDMPRAPEFDSTLSLKRDPYHYIARTADQVGSDVFATRILLQPAICMTGREAVRLFYDEDRFMRSGAAPARLQRTLFGCGGVQSLDGTIHEIRKGMFMSLMTAPRITELGDLFDRHVKRAARQWIGMDRVTLYPELREVLCRT